MRQMLFIFSLVMMLSCTSTSLQELREETPVMMTVLRGGQNAQGISLFTLDETTGVQHPVTDATLTIEEEGGPASPLTYSAEGYGSSEFTIEPSGHYIIRGKAADRDLSASIEIPPAISLLLTNNDTLSVNSSSPGAAIAFFTWTPLNTENYSYLCRLECLEEDPQEIPFNVPSGNFAESFNGPILEIGIIVSASDFKYYGRHRLTVFAIDKSLEALFFYGPGDIRGLLTNGPDNVQGIKGFVAGVSAFDTEFVIVPQ